MISIRLSDLSQKLDAQLYGDKNVIIKGISSIENAKTGDITFLSNIRFRKKLSFCKASAIIISADALPYCNINAIVVKNPYLSYIHIIKIMGFLKEIKISKNISDTAVIDKNVIIGNNTIIGANSIILSGTKIENNVFIGPGCFIGNNIKIKFGTKLLANVIIHNNVKIGSNCFIQSGTVIGSDGFGYINNKNKWIKIPHIGRVKIGNKVEIGSCTTIDKGTLDDTIIGNGVIIDNQCHIAHNVIIKNNTAIAGGVIIAGSTSIGKHCMIGGASVINGHIKICDNVIITGMSMVIRSINKSGTYSSGMPLQSNTKWKKTAVILMKINDIRKRIKKIEKFLKK
ncbi:UDP-3-O-(3-hydroxymyristoyl)glucosamine N-acyltransferase [Sodalis-like secondary symbiont of Drepanosiphum platanoidis]|uniref:UDP-3-O-(3-hydroxymyristoyl)glucosamine N-acyltransferase n=1 Tax=Sodalis-like secondary symbiont of Drepanosiphum platanoidis TaxID=2994493 RepID=UPI0034642900